jgi:hypothetical protein
MLTNLRDRRGPAWFFTGQAGCYCCEPDVVIGYAVYFYGATGTGAAIRDTDKYEVDAWTSKTDAPAAARSYAGAASIEAIAYIMGGGSSTAILDENISYVQSTDVFTTKAVMTEARTFLYGVAVNGKAYAIAGYEVTFTTKVKTVYQYTPGTDTWATKTNIPDPARTEGAAASVGVNAYIYGGAGTGAIQDNDQYNSSTDAWTSKTDMPSPARVGNMGWSIDGLAYTCTGFNMGTFYKDVDEYNPSSDSWTGTTDISGAARRNAAGCAPGNTSQGFVTAGSGAAFNASQDHESFTPSAWTTRTQIVAPARQRLSCAESI